MNLSNLLKIGDYKSIGDKFYLPNSSTRPSRLLHSSPEFFFDTNNPLCSSSFGPFGTLSKLFLEAAGLLSHLQSTNSLNVTNLQPILLKCRDFFNQTIEYFGSESVPITHSEWILRAATSNYIYVGLLISKAAELEGDTDERIGEVFHSIKKCFAIVNKKDDSKRPIMIFLFAQCFSLMFKLRRLGLFSSILTSFQVLNGEKLLPRARRVDSVQFLYYRALYDFHGQKMKEAWERFSETWMLLHKNDSVHRRRVGAYLIAIALVHGKAPSLPFLQTLNLTNEFESLVRAIKRGDLLGFQRELKANSLPLHQLKVFTFLRLNMEPAVYLNLIRWTWKLCNYPKMITFKQILLVASSYNAGTNTGIGSGSGMNSQHELLSEDELECILVNLIGKGWIKGNLGHETGVLILSPIEPFPIQLK